MCLNAKKIVRSTPDIPTIKKKILFLKSTTNTVLNADET